MENLRRGPGRRFEIHEATKDSRWIWKQAVVTLVFYIIWTSPTAWRARCAEKETVTEFSMKEHVQRITTIMGR